MKRFFCMMMVLTFVWCFSGAAFAATITYSRAKVEITVLDKWRVLQESGTLTFWPSDDSLQDNNVAPWDRDAAMSAADKMKQSIPNASMSIIFMAIEQAASDKVFEILNKELEKKLGPITWGSAGKAIEENINGMPTTEWTGKTNDGRMMVGCFAINTLANKSLGIYWFATVENQKKYDTDIVKIIKGLKPLAKMNKF
ncbi:MAG: hypothetical protein HQM09_24205 [Candidatus Riflebacteria bacterium]|nr:hypothetical protein [Candidatus Riflebacteria bacterium]